MKARCMIILMGETMKHFSGTPFFLRRAKTQQSDMALLSANSFHDKLFKLQIYTKIFVIKARDEVVKSTRRRQSTP